MRILFFIPLAAFPVVMLMLFVYIKAGKGKVSTKLMGLLVAMGGISTIPIAMLEFFGDIWLLGLHIPENMKVLVEFFLIVGVVEELGKYLFLVLLTWKHPCFKHSYSAIVYAVCTSLGFALVENILYVMLGGFSIGILRAFTAVPLHCVLAILMGFLYAIGREAAYQKNIGKSVFFMALAYVIPVLIHGFYDVMADRVSESGRDFTAFVFVVIVLLTVGTVILFYSSKRNHRLDGLPDTLYPEIPADPYSYPQMPVYYGMMPYGGMPPNVGMQPYGGMQPNVGMLPYGGMQPNVGMQPYGGMQPNVGMPPYGEIQPNVGMPPYGGMPPNVGMPTYGGMQPNVGMSPYGGMPPNVGMAPYGGMQPNVGMPPYGGMQPNIGMAPCGGMQPNVGMPPYGEIQPNVGMPQYEGMQPDTGMSPYGGEQAGNGAVSGAAYYAATEYDNMYPDYNVWQGCVLPPDQPDVLYAPGRTNTQEDLR